MALGQRPDGGHHHRGDDALANAIKHAGSVVLPISFDMIGEEKIILDDTLMDNTFLRIQKENSFKNFHPISLDFGILAS